jgi:hypothetical protein
LAINFAPVADMRTLVLGLLVVTAIALVLFIIRQRRAENPLYDLKVAARPTFWVAAVGGIIVMGSLMGAMFIGQQFLQDVLGYSTVNAGLAILPAALFMVVVAPRSAKLVEVRGSRFTLLAGYLFVLLGFITMLLLWNEGIPYWMVGLGYSFVGIGVGLAGTPASRSLTASVPVTRVGMASGTADLQRDLGGALMQSIFGALLAAGYAASMTATLTATGSSAEIPATVTNELTMSYAGAQSVVATYPQYADQIAVAAKTAFLACCSARRWSSSSTPSMTTKASCSPVITPQTCKPRAQPSEGYMIAEAKPQRRRFVPNIISGLATGLFSISEGMAYTLS